MRLDHSYGVVPLKKVAGEWLVFLVRHTSGHWTLPKGHPESQELPLECAKRELFEETGLTIQTLLFDEPLCEHYQFTNRGTLIQKTVEYFIAEVEGREKLQIEEIQDGRWLGLTKAQDLATYPQMKSLLYTVSQMVK